MWRAPSEPPQNWPPKWKNNYRILLAADAAPAATATAVGATVAHVRERVMWWVCVCVSAPASASSVGKMKNNQNNEESITENETTEKKTKKEMVGNWQATHKKWHNNC